MAKKKLDRSTAAKVRQKRKAARPNVRKELESLERILKECAVGPKQALSNAVLTDMLWGRLQEGSGGRNVHDVRQRQLRKRVMQLRRGGSPVALALGRCGGYFWPDDSRESLAARRATSEMLDKRADTSHALAARLVGLGRVEYLAKRAAAKIAEEEEPQQEAALRQFVDGLNRNPITRAILLKVVGEPGSAKAKARLATLLEAQRKRTLRLIALSDALQEEVAGMAGGG